MNLSIVTTAIPSLGRLVIELQPSMHAFTINEDSAEVRAANEKFIFSSMGGGSFNHDFHFDHIHHQHHHHGGGIIKPGTSVQVSTGWRENSRDDDDSTQELMRDPSFQQNVIQQTIHFEVH